MAAIRNYHTAPVAEFRYLFHYYRLDNRTDINSHGFRLGLGTNSPPQFGQILFISPAHFPQKVHSYEQITAMPFGSSS
jgi:hypothetical protein